jgi:hypothetical protein
MKRVLGFVFGGIAIAGILGAIAIFGVGQLFMRSEVERDHEDGKLVSISQAFQYNALSQDMLIRFLHYGKDVSKSTKKEMKDELEGMTLGNKEILVNERYSNLSQEDKKSVDSVISVATGYGGYMNLYFNKQERFLGGNIQAQ